MSKLPSKLGELFGIDDRSLAVLRMATAALVLADLLLRARDLRAHYTDFGVLPRGALAHYFANEWHLSIHMLGGTLAIQAVLFLVAAVLAVALLIGYRTRLATIASWFFLVSLHNRNPMVLQGGDDLLRLMLFWGIFLPWGESYSVDAYQRGEARPPRQHLSFGTVGYLVQVVSVYIFTVFLKTGPEWRTDGTAVQLALSLDQFRMPLGDLLLQFPRAMKLLTHASFWFEAIGPWLYFVPWRTKYFRTLTAAAFCLFHIGLGLHLRLGLFPLISCSATLGFLPGALWELRWSRFFLAWVEVFLKAAAQRLPTASQAFAWPQPMKRVGQTMLPALFLIYVFIWNLGSTDFVSLSLTGHQRTVANLLRLDQHWNLFSPAPFTDDGWYVIPGELFAFAASGEKIDILRGGKELSWEKPVPVRELYPTYRWRKYMHRLWLLEYERHRLFFGRYLCRQWNSTYYGPHQLRSFQIIYMLEETLDDLTEATPEPKVVWNHRCFTDVALD